LFVAVLNRSQPAGIFYSDNASSGTPTWTPMDVPILPIGSGTAIGDVSDNGVSPIVITSVGHGLDADDNSSVLVMGVTGNTAANGQFRVTVIDADTFSLDGTTGNGDYISGGVWTRITGPNPRPKDFDSATGGQGGTHFSIRAEPSDADILYVGGDRQEQPNSIGDNTFGVARGQ
jgi:hypothetical protein